MHVLIEIAAVACCVGLVVIAEGKRAPERWVCPRCAGEVEDADECPCCGERKEP